jgi:hypothetical protein
MEYSASPTADVTAPVQPAAQSPVPLSVSDLEQRLAVLKSAGVREYQDGGVHILFERPKPREEIDPIRALELAAQAERIASGG